MGGLGECLASYPLDTVKTRMQTQPGSAGVMDFFSVAIREDGPLALYRFATWLVGWLVGWLAGWLAGWLLGGLAGCFVGWLVDGSVDCTAVGLSVGW